MTNSIYLIKKRNRTFKYSGMTMAVARGSKVCKKEDGEILTNHRFAHVPRQVGGNDTMFNDLTETLQSLLLLNRCYWTWRNYPILRHHTHADIGKSATSIIRKAKTSHYLTFRVSVTVKRWGQFSYGPICNPNVTKGYVNLLRGYRQ